MAAHSGVIQADSLSKKALQRNPHASPRINTSEPVSPDLHVLSTRCLVFVPGDAQNSRGGILMKRTSEINVEN